MEVGPNNCSPNGKTLQLDVSYNLGCVRSLQTAAGRAKEAGFHFSGLAFFSRRTKLGTSRLFRDPRGKGIYLLGLMVLL